MAKEWTSGSGKENLRDERVVLDGVLDEPTPVLVTEDHSWKGCQAPLFDREVLEKCIEGGAFNKQEAVLWFEGDALYVVSANGPSLPEELDRARIMEAYPEAVNWQECEMDGAYFVVSRVEPTVYLDNGEERKAYAVGNGWTWQRPFWLDTESSPSP